MGCLKWKVDSTQKCPNYKPEHSEVDSHVIPCEFRKRRCIGDNFCAFEPRTKEETK